MKKVLFLDDDKSLCFLMVELFAESRDIEIVTASSYAQFITHEKDILTFDIIFLDVNLGAGCPTGLDAFQWLREKDYRNKIVFFTGHALSYPEVKEALKTPNVFNLEKPAPIKKIEDLIRS